MFRKTDQDLFARVFDEGQAGDPGIEWLRDGLKDLREVPAHGLSNERLRDRLLGTSLAPASKPTPWWMWAWAPVAAATLAVMILPRLGMHQEPSVVTNFGTVATNREVRPPLTIGRPNPATVQSKPPMATNPSEEASVDQEMLLAVNSSFDEPPARDTFRVRARRTNRTRVAVQVRPPIVTPDNAPIITSEALTTLNNDMATAQRSESGAAFKSRELPTMALAASSDDSSDPLVLLTPDIDTDTGAVRATEVDSPANLSIGG